MRWDIAYMQTWRDRTEHWQQHVLASHSQERGNSADVCMQNVKPEKLFTKARAVKQLLDIIEGVTMETNGSYLAWDGQNIPF